MSDAFARSKASAAGPWSKVGEFFVGLSSFLAGALKGYIRLYEFVCGYAVKAVDGFMGIWKGVL